MLLAAALLGSACAGPARLRAGDAGDVVTPQSLDALERDAAGKVNERREAEGLAPLEGSAALASVARAYSCRMGEEGFFDHMSPDGDSVADRVEAAGIRYRAVGENLAFVSGARDPVDVVVDGWMESPGHRANILSDVYSHAGMGICVVDGTYYFTQVFLLPR